MTEQALVVRDSGWAIAEQVIIKGDLSRLTEQQRMTYYSETCHSLGLNPLTRPFEYIILNGKMTLYPNKGCTDQLRSIRSISVYKLEREQTTETYDVTAYGRDTTGREDASLGSVSIIGLKGEPLSNAKMKAETKAKRRLTLSLCGLGMVDESEIDSIPSAQRVEQPKHMTLAEVAAEKRQAIAETPQDAPQAAEAVYVDTVTTPALTDAEVAPVAPAVVRGRQAIEQAARDIAAERCGWALQPKSGPQVPCTLGEMHAGEHSFVEGAIKTGGRVVRLDA